MVKVKICGLRRPEDIAAANEVKPDYIGFIFAPSRRRITPEEAVGLNRLLSRGIKKVGVFVNGEIDFVVATAKKVNLDVVQLHGEEDHDYIAELRRRLPEQTRVWLKIGMPVKRCDSGLSDNGSTGGSGRGSTEGNRTVSFVYEPEGLENLEGVDALLLDTAAGHDAEAVGGTGQTFAWDLARDLCRKYKVIVAGGLSPDNVQTAIKTLNPYGVDVSTHVETEGYKNKDKMALFVSRVREARQYHG